MHNPDLLVFLEFGVVVSLCTGSGVLVDKSDGDRPVHRRLVVVVLVVLVKVQQHVSEVARIYELHEGTSWVVVVYDSLCQMSRILKTKSQTS